MENRLSLPGGTDDQSVTSTPQAVTATRVATVDADPTEPYAAISQAEALALELSPEQRTAIELLTAGKTAVAAATAAGVSRATVYRWMKTDAVFIAAFNAWQRDVLATTRGRLLALSELAVTTVAKAMTRGDARTALALLRSMGTLERPAQGPTDPEEVKRQQTMDLRRTRVARMSEEAKLADEEMSSVR